MAKTAVSQWDTVAANNTDLNSIPIDGAVTTPSQVDNLFREMMAQIKTFSTTVTISVGVSVDNAIPRFDGVAGALQGSGVTVSDIGAMVIESTDAGATGPSLEFKHSSASPAANDVVGAFTFSGKDSGGNVTTYAQVVGYIVATTDGAESGGVIWRTMRAGSFANRFILGLGLYSQGLSDPGDGKVNANGFQKAGVEFGNDVADQVVTGGARITSLSLGTITTGTVTPDPGDRPMQHYTNGGAHTLAPGSNNGFYTLDITNNGSAGAITTSGWTKVSGSVFTTTNGHKFRCSCSVGDAGSLLSVQAMQ